MFAEKGSAACLEEIARHAELGIGTLYRHFPHRDALVEEVYRTDSEELVAAATRLAETGAPVEALRLWLKLFVDHLATKQAMAELLGSLAGGPGPLYASSGRRVLDALSALVARAAAAGEIHFAGDPTDLLRALFGVASAGAGADGPDNARRFVDVLIAGISAPSTR